MSAMSNSNLTPSDKLASARGADIAEPERNLWEGGFSGKSMFGSWLAAVLVSLLVPVLILFVVPMQVNTTVWLAGAILVAAIWLFLLATMVYRKVSQHYLVTNQRLKHRDGILVRNMDRIELIDIDDVTYRQGIVQAMLGVGDIKITSSDSSHPELTMYGIAKVSDVADMIDDARREERRKRGLHIESV